MALPESMDRGARSWDGGGQAVQCCPPHPPHAALGAKCLLPVPNSHGNLPSPAWGPSSGTHLRDAAAAGAGAEVPAGDQAWMAGWQHRPLSVLAH